jgi:hypothetical protein
MLYQGLIRILSGKISECGFHDRVVKVSTEALRSDL